MDNTERPEGIGEDGEITIHNLDHASAILDEAKSRMFKEVENAKPAPKFEHLPVANIVLKVIRVGIRDKFVQDVMIRRILGPIQTGKERSHLSIALELGAREHDVVAAEQAGVKMMETLIGGAEEHMAKFNREQKV